MARPRTRLALVVLLGLVSIVVLGALAMPSAAAETEDVENVTVYRMSSLSEVDPSAFERAIANGTVDPAERVVIGDTVVVAIESERLADSLDAQNGSTTDGFLQVIDENATFRIEQTNPTPERQPKLAVLGPENVSVSRDGSTTYAFLNSSSLRFGYEGNPTAGQAEIYADEEFAFLFGYGLSDNPDIHDREALPEVEFYPSRAEFYDNAYYRPLPPERVEFPLLVHVPPTRSLTVRLELPANRTITTPGPTNETGLESVSMNLSEVEPGTPYTLELVYDGTVLDTYDGTVRKPRADLSEVELIEVGNQAAVSLSANLSHGGGVVALDQHCAKLALEYAPPGEETPMALTLYDHDGSMIPADDIDSLPIVVRSLREDTATEAVYTGSSSRASLNTNVTCEAGVVSDPPQHTTTGEQQSTTSTNPSTTATDGSTTLSTPVTTGGSGGDGTTGGGQGTTTTSVPGFTAPLAILGLLGGLGVHLRRR